MFDIKTSFDFLAKLDADYADFKAQPDSTRHALNCIMTAYHLHEWVWGDWLKTNYRAWQEIGGIRDKDSFKMWLVQSCPDWTVIEELTNGTKHLRRGSVETERIAGYGNGPWGVGPYGRPYLLINYGNNSSPRYKTAEQLIDSAIAFWHAFFGKYSGSSI